MSVGSKHTRFYALVWTAKGNPDKEGMIVASADTGKLAIFIHRPDADREGDTYGAGRVRVVDFLARCKDRCAPFPGVQKKGEPNGNR